MFPAKLKRPGHNILYQRADWQAKDEVEVLAGLDDVG
jgi:hypothetical protein